MSALQRRRLRLLARICAFSAVLGAAYGAIAAQLTEGSFAHASMLNGVAIGVMTSITCAGLDLVVMPTGLGAQLKRAPFVVVVLAKGLWYGVAVTAAMSLGTHLFGAEPWSWHETRFQITVALSFAVAQLVAFTIVLSDHLGHGVLRNLATGRYHRPREEQRVFLFVDMIGSTAIAERIGPTAFLTLLDRFAADLAEPVIEHHGTVYRYVGDEVIVTWPEAKGIAEANCIRCVLAMRAAIARRAPSYRTQFGLVPEFRAALHAGPVVAGEMGAAKREIVFLGDAVNTTARIETACRELGHDSLISGVLLERVQLPPGVDARLVGPIELRGKAQPMPLYALVAA
jgi:adenylate cyclase